MCQATRGKQYTETAYTNTGAEASSVICLECNFSVQFCNEFNLISSILPQGSICPSALLTEGCQPSSCISVKPIQTPVLLRIETWRTPYKSLKVVWPSLSVRRRRSRTNSAWPSSTLWILEAAHHSGLVKVRVRHLERSEDFTAFLTFFFLSGKTLEVEGGVRRATQTAPPHYRSVLEDTRMEMERL